MTNGPAAPLRPSSLVLRHWSTRWVVKAGLIYVGVVLVMMALENWLVYQGTPAPRGWLPPPSDRVQDVTLYAADGTRLHAWWLPRDGADGAVLYCHGNAGNLSHRGPNLLRWGQEMNVGVLIFDYPGYGKSDGSPNEKSCCAAADAAYDWLVGVAKVPAERILLYGDSLGGGVATDLAGRREHRALVLMRTFTSLPDTAAHVYPWLPVRRLMRNRYDNVTKIARCHRPVFIAHGDADTLIPITLGERLYAAANGPKFFLPLSGVGHNEPVPPAFFGALRRFLKEHAP